MELNEHDSPPTSDGVFYSSTDNANLQWYHYWSSQVGHSGLWYPQMIDSGSGDWNHHPDHFQSGNYSDSESTSRPMMTLNSLSQEQPNYYGLASGTGHSSLHVPPDSVLQTPIDQGYRHHEPFFGSWAPEVTASSNIGAQSRRPSYYSDPGLPTNFPDNTTHQALSGVRPNTRPSAITTSSADGANAPSAAPSHTTDSFASAEFSCSASTSPVDEHEDRPAIRCYDHGCDGRTFSSISNFRRHQRERAGQGPVCFCPRCGATFYRRWTRDHHVERGSCLRLPRWH